MKLNEVTSIGSVPFNDNDYPLLTRALGQEDGCSTHLILQYKRTCEIYWQS